LTKYGLLRITKDCFEFDPNPAAPPIALEMAKAVFTLGASSCTESYVMSRTLAEGPKVFAFSDALTCEALENFDLSVSTADYLQPFPSVVIEPPADYTRKRVVPFEEGSHAPDFVVVRHETGGWLRAGDDSPDLRPGLVRGRTRFLVQASVRRVGAELHEGEREVF
jgi:hypothetical protein